MATSLEEKIDTLTRTVTDLASRLQNLEDANAIKNLHHAYGYYLDKCLYTAVVNLFSNSPETAVHFLNGIWQGKAGARRLYVDWFSVLFTGGKNSPPRGFLLDHLMMQDIVSISRDSGGKGGTAKARFRCLLQGGSHHSVPTKERPKGVQEQFWEGGLYENEYVFEDGVWKILKLGYNMLWQAEYEKGWSNSEAMKGVERCFPEDPLGPDEIVTVGKEVWPETRLIPFHYKHPVTGEEINAGS
ncbi:hypothetical protein LSUE1_G009387 [Lachnellula suecica]|uniref:SnoaL-like domain-containing protein n=1 Tax=Lachnellula suecica TaxID=602035 RepID=A0A8T9CDB0_9HELO|nr:hypothetical protein LSUE1_G009387 [Lachnellula suecica]